MSVPDIAEERMRTLVGGKQLYLGPWRRPKDNELGSEETEGAHAQQHRRIQPKTLVVPARPSLSHVTGRHCERVQPDICAPKSKAWVEWVRRVEKRRVQTLTGGCRRSSDSRALRRSTSPQTARTRPSPPRPASTTPASQHTSDRPQSLHAPQLSTSMCVFRLSRHGRCRGQRSRCAF